MSMTVSVILPVRNECAFIEQGLGAILSQSYPAERIEVLVVDGMSEDGTRDIVRSYIRHNPERSIRLFDNPARFAPQAFNIGIQEARGDVVIIVGGHSQIASDYVRECVRALNATGADCVGGLLNTVGQTRVARAISLAQSSPFGVGGVAFRTGVEKGTFVDTVAFGAYRKEVFQRIGLFDEELVRNQDDEFNFRLTQAGGRIWLEPAVRSVYYSRASLSRLWHQYFQYGAYKVRVMQKRGAVPAWRHLVPCMFVVALMLSLLLTLVTGQLWWALVVMLPYLVANVTASTWAARRDWGTLPLLPFAYGILHLAYGTGFLAGLRRWRGRWHENTPVTVDEAAPIGSSHSRSSSSNAF